jgi:hypothetical protein
LLIIFRDANFVLASFVVVAVLLLNLIVFDSSIFFRDLPEPGSGFFTAVIIWRENRRS